MEDYFISLVTLRDELPVTSLESEAQKQLLRNFPLKVQGKTSMEVPLVLQGVEHVYSYTVCLCLLQ